MNSRPIGLDPSESDYMSLLDEDSSDQTRSCAEKTNEIFSIVMIFGLLGATLALGFDPSSPLRIGLHGGCALALASSVGVGRSFHEVPRELQAKDKCTKIFLALSLFAVGVGMYLNATNAFDPLVQELATPVVILAAIQMMTLDRRGSS